MSNRSMYGTENFEGQEVNGLRIGQMIARRPAPRYNAQCVRCGCEQTASQKDLYSGKARCQNSACGRDVERLREELSMTPRKYAQREARFKQDRVDAIAQQVKSNAQKIALMEREMILTQRDDAFDLRQIDPQYAEASMSQAEADAFNVQQFRQFLQECPEFWHDPEHKNVSTLGDYLARQGATSIISVPMIKAGFRRLDLYGLLLRRPTPQPAPQPPTAKPSIERAPEPTKRREPEEGFDLRTGERRIYTPYEIDRLSADDYRRVFRLYGERRPTFPNHAAF